MASTEDPANCQRNIVLRRNIGRWPRQGGPRQGGNHAGSHYVARNYPDCDGNIPNGGGNWHCCFASYGGGSGVQFLNNHCEGERQTPLPATLNRSVTRAHADVSGAHGIVRFLASYPFTVKNQTK